MTRRYTIVGAGAIGGLVGAALHETGHDVTFVEANPEHAAAIRADGLRISGWREMTCSAPVLSPDELEGPLDCVLLAVKSIATEAAIDLLRGKLAPDGVVVSLQNGLNEYALAATFGAEQVIGAYLTFGGYLEGPGVIRYAGEGSFKLGELDGQRSDRVTALAMDFGALQACEVTDNIFGYLWAKMVLGAVYYGTAILDRDCLVIFADESAREVLGRAATEAAHVAQANGVALESCDGFLPLAFAAGDEAGIAASWDAQRAYWSAHVGAGRTGVWRDLAIHKRKTECSAHVGAVIRRRGSVPTPTLDKIADCIAQIETGKRSLGWQNLAMLR